MSSPNPPCRSGPSILCRWWIPACALAWSIFFIYEIGIGCDKIFSKHPLCPYSDIDFGNWYWSINYIVLGGFFLTWIMLLMKIIQMKPGPARVPHFTAFNIVSIGTIATLLALVWNWGGVCEDALKTFSPAAIWGEWIATGPLLILITVTVVDKPELSRMDWMLMTTFFLCLVFAFFIIAEQSYAWGVFWLTMSVLTYLPLLYLPFYVTRKPVRPDGSEEYTAAPVDDLEDIALGHLYMKRYNLAVWLTIILPLYTLNYILAWAGVIDAAVTIVVYQLLSVLTKGLFAALCMDAHVDSLMEAERAVERRANASRRAFLKYIFHEVRTPLNSLTMGIEILQMSENLEEEDMESLMMMKGASEFMSDTLNDVLSMQKIEEGKLELDMSPFSIKDAINKVFLSLRGASSTKKIMLSMQVPDAVPAKVIGDRYRIEHVISNLVSNAIKFTPDGRNVRVAVTSGPINTKPTAMNNNRRTVDVTISILDEGIGISPENQKKLFNNFVQIRPGALQQGQGSGLGLSLCKQIVTLHGGTIGVHSAEGQGSTFSFTIPFSVYDAPSVMSLSTPVSQRDNPRLSIISTLAMDESRDRGRDHNNNNSNNNNNNNNSTRRASITAKVEPDQPLPLSNSVPALGSLTVPLTASLISPLEHKDDFNESSTANMNRNRNSIHMNNNKNYNTTPVTINNNNNNTRGSGSSSVMSEVVTTSSPSISNPRQRDSIMNRDATTRDSIISVTGGSGCGGSIVVGSSRRESMAENRIFDLNDGLEVLVVDDVESNRKMMMMLLRKNGVNTKMAENGQVAVQLVKANMDTFKLVFMDNLMPVMDGVEATKMLRREGYRHIIVGVTGNVLEDDIQEYLEAGADFIIGKPLKMPQLEMILRHVKDNGSISQPGMRLMEQQPNKLEWTPWP